MKCMSDRMLGKGVWRQREKEAFWLVHRGNRPAGFCSVADIGYGVAYFSAAAVEKWARGGGLQRRMIRVRLRWARRRGLRTVVTYTVKDNYPSIANLIKCGFRFYDPEDPWAGKDVLYFILNL
jgi:RimJ/RimL family protein N-acetyltransferase